MLMGLDFQEAEFQPVLKKRRLVTKASPVAKKAPVEDSVVDVRVTIPVLINNVPIQSGGELLLFKAKAIPRPRAQQPITMQSLTKNPSPGEGLSRRCGQQQSCFGSHLLICFCFGFVQASQSFSRPSPSRDHVPSSPSRWRPRVCESSKEGRGSDRDRGI